MFTGTRQIAGNLAQKDKPFFPETFLTKTPSFNAFTDHAAEHGVNWCSVYFWGLVFFSARLHRVSCQTLTRNTEKNLHGLNVCWRYCQIELHMHASRSDLPQKIEVINVQTGKFLKLLGWMLNSNKLETPVFSVDGKSQRSTELWSLGLRVANWNRKKKNFSAASRVCVCVCVCVCAREPERSCVCECVCEWGGGGGSYCENAPDNARPVVFFFFSSKCTCYTDSV